MTITSMFHPMVTAHRLLPINLVRIAIELLIPQKLPVKLPAVSQTQVQCSHHDNRNTLTAPANQDIAAVRVNNPITAACTRIQVAIDTVDVPTIQDAAVPVVVAEVEPPSNHLLSLKLPSSMIPQLE